MPKFRIQVTAVAQSTYEVEVDAVNEDAATLQATSLWREKTSDDFQVASIHHFETELAGQLTWECETCHAPIAEADSFSYDDHCRACYLKCDDCGAPIATVEDLRAQGYRCRACALIAIPT